jgi:hypothetical protein
VAGLVFDSAYGAPAWKYQHHVGNQGKSVPEGQGVLIPDGHYFSMSLGVDFIKVVKTCSLRQIWILFSVIIIIIIGNGKFYHR